VKFLASYRLARASLRAHRLRTILTILGVVIGAFIITLVLLLGLGLRQSIVQQVAKLNENLVLVRSGESDTSGLEVFSPYNIPRVTNLHEHDLTAASSSPAVSDVTPMMFFGGRVAGTENSFSGITIVATNENLPRVLNLKMQSGHFWDSGDAARNWVVLGEKLAAGLLGTDQAMGQKITIKGQEYLVIGILRVLGQPISLAGVDIDKAAFVSMTNGRKFNGGDIPIGQILARAADGTKPDAAVRDLQKTLAAVHVDDSEFSVIDATTAARATAGWVETITMAALIFAGISLLVGGISIMNIMLVSVTERTREIGIRKAVGATRSKIMAQFLLEALIMTALGGAVGLALAYGTAYLVDLQFSLPLIFDWWIIAVALLVPIAVGLVFGLWPAARAARQDPIVALRQYH
jgi:putative ABC transport system permease protein